MDEYINTEQVWAQSCSKLKLKTKTLIDFSAAGYFWQFGPKDFELEPNPWLQTLAQETLHRNKCLYFQKHLQDLVSIGSQLLVLGTFLLGVLLQQAFFPFV